MSSVKFNFTIYKKLKNIFFRTFESDVLPCKHSTIQSTIINSSDVKNLF